MRKISLTVPFDGCLSKNRMWRHTKTGRVYINPATKRAIEAIAWEIKSRRLGWLPIPTLVYIDITVPSGYWDGVNFIDAIMDAVEQGTGVNDRLYSVVCLPRVDADAQWIYIAVMQVDGVESHKELFRRFYTDGLWEEERDVE